LLEAVSSIGGNTTEAVQEAVIGAVRVADAVGSETGSSVRKALLSAAAPSRDVVEKTIPGASEE
jgi:hypothetical protein